MPAPPRRSLNPGFVPPREYLKAGFFEPGGQVPRENLRTSLAVAMARELLIRAVPLELVAQALKELETIPRLTSDAAEVQRRLKEMAARQVYQAHAPLAQLLAAGVAQVRRREDLTALTAHVRRVMTLAHMERALARANGLELLLSAQRAERRAHVKAARRRKPGRA